MLYRELVTFEPLESVKQLRAASNTAQALEDVRTFVISEKMRQALTQVAIPQLRFDNVDVDHKGLLLIATYGTGKTHLMSMISAVAENSDLAAAVSDEPTAEAFGAIAGKFKVVRVEIGSVKMGLRDIVAQELTAGLAELGVDYTFPPLDKITNNKAPLQDMMAVFEEEYPEHGLLLVIDELLDYLRTRRDSEIILDLGFLREMGEFCRDSRFRLIAGVQESLFDNPRFAVAQDEIQRVRERYQSFRIAREDVAYVVQRRILQKDESQRKAIREHLSKFAPAFESLGSNLEGFTDMFPVHPAYLATFESLTIVEKRRVLTTLSESIRALLDTPVPDDNPGLLCADSYRAELDSDPGNRVIPEVASVLERTRVLRERVQRGMSASSDIPPALRIVDALAVNRLTTDDIDAPIGLTVEELRDDLCLIPPGTPELDPDFLASSIETLISEISQAVSGQFLTVNPVNGQVYLDLKKDVDYEQQIDDRAKTLDNEDLDRAYYTAVEQLLEVSRDPYVAGYQIWSYELPWQAKRCTRFGYLFMGAPNERSTAQPPRDFYIYFLQPYAPPRFDDEARADEVFLRLTDPGEEFTSSLRRYAAAHLKASEVTQQHRAAFESRRQKHLTEMVSWLKNHLGTNLEVTHEGVSKPLGQWVAGLQGPRSSLKDQVDTVSSTALSAHFSDRYPDYPTFRDEITRANLATNVQAALRTIATGQDTNMGVAVLEALALRAVDGNITSEGRYASQLLDQLTQASGQAVNADDLLQSRDPGVQTWGPWHLEPLWLVVVTAALIYLGNAELQLDNGTRFTAANLVGLAQVPQNELEAISFIATPAGTDLDALRAAAELLGVVPGTIVAPLPNDVVKELTAHASAQHEKAAEAIAQIQDGPRLWGEEIFDDPDARIARIKAFDDVADDLRNRNTPGKMGRFALTSDQQRAAKSGKAELKRHQDLLRAVEQFRAPVGYAEKAGQQLGQDDPYRNDARQTRDDLRRLLRAETFDKVVATEIKRSIEALKDNYRTFAVEHHTRDRLTSAGDRRKQDVTQSPTYQDLRVLASVQILQGGQFATLQNRLAGIRACPQFAAAVFDEDFYCNLCGYQPTLEGGVTAEKSVEDAAKQTQELWNIWTDALKDNLGQPEVTKHITLLSSAQQTVLKPVVKGTLAPGEATAEMAEAIEAAFQRMTVLAVHPDDIWAALFPSSAARTPHELADAFTAWLSQLSRNVDDPASVRVVPSEDS